MATRLRGTTASRRRKHDVTRYTSVGNVPMCCVGPFVSPSSFNDPIAAWRDLSLQRKGLVVVTIPCVLLFTGVLALFILHQAERRVRTSVDHTYRVRVQTERTKGLILAAENAVRSYLLTTRADSRQAYQRARLALTDSTNALSALVQGDADQALRTGSVAYLIADRVKALDVLVERPLAVDDPFVQRLLRTGTAVLVSVDTELEAIIAAEQERLVRQDANVETLTSGAQILVAASVAVGFGGGLLAMVLFTTGVSSRLRQVAGNVQEFVMTRDIRNPLPPARDEIGQLSASLQSAAVLLSTRERDLAAARDEADAANRAKSDFLSRTSHELRTPLNSIIGFGQLLELSSLEGPDAESVQHVMRAGRHLLGVITEVLDIARIEAGRMDLSLEPVALAEVAREALELVGPLAAERGLTLDASSIEDEAVYVQADRQRLKQVVLNLLSNAVKYNRERGSITLRIESAADAARLIVTDTGAGITAERMTSLYMPFDRLGAESSNVEGTGLGLALSQRLMEAMGGRIEVASTPGVGSSFSLQLALAQAPLAEVPATLGVAPGPTDRPRTFVVLYIEDNVANLNLIERVLGLRPTVELLVSMHGQLGVEMAWQHQPDLILLDMHLPDQHGCQVIKQIRDDARTAATPIMVLSADATPGQIERARAAGATEYLAKPLDLHQFLATVDACLGGEAAA